MKPSFKTLYEGEVSPRLEAPRREALITEQDLVGLPQTLKKYLRRVGIIGNPRVHNFRASFRGEMRRSHDSGWMKIRAEQHSFFGPRPARLFHVKGALLGIPFEGLHRFIGPAATMQVRVASLFEVVDARGSEMDQGETVTFFNDLCLLAPAALLDADLTWEEEAGLLKGTLRHQGHCVSALLSFDEEGDLLDFISEDRFQSSDGKHYQRFPWSTPVRDYRDLDGLHLPAKADAIWHESDGPFPYARFEVEAITYNVQDLAQPSR